MREKTVSRSVYDYMATVSVCRENDQKMLHFILAIQILAAPKGAPRGGRGMGNPHANGEFQGESAPEYYGRIEQQRYHRSHPPLGGPPSVYVASRYQSNGGLNRTSERKTSVR